MLRRYLIAGTFDMLHIGHKNLLKVSFQRHINSTICRNEYFIAVTTDKYTQKYKKITLTENEQIRIANIRNYCLTHYPYINFKFILSDGNWSTLYQNYNITHIIHGDDWLKETYITHMDRESIEKFNIKVILVPHTPGISSTMLRLKKSNI